MKFYFDTNDYNSIKIDIVEFDLSVSDAIQEFCFAMSLFFVNFVMYLNCDTRKKVEVWKDICTSYIDRNINSMLNNQDDINKLTEKMKEHGFSEAEITNMVKFVTDCGNIDTANNKLEEILINHLERISK